MYEYTRSFQYPSAFHAWLFIRESHHPHQRLSIYGFCMILTLKYEFYVYIFEIRPRFVHINSPFPVDFCRCIFIHPGNRTPSAFRYLYLIQYTCEFCQHYAVVGYRHACCLCLRDPAEHVPSVEHAGSAVYHQIESCQENHCRTR